MRYALDIAYQGSAYAGWQRQPNANSIQAELEQALGTVLRTTVETTGAGRTDAGVHARCLTVHFDCEAQLQAGILHNLNGVLPGDIAAHTLYQAVAPDFHARFSALYRGYTYLIVPRKDPFWRDLAAVYRYPLDLDAMQTAARMLTEYEDFASFCKAHGANETTRCQLHHAYWEQREDGLLAFHIRANRFLRGMVRAIVGTMLLVGSGKLHPEAFRDVIEGEDRRFAGPNAEACGLYLTEVGYPEGMLTVLD
ncbi:MAG: tRNA pseudouridine(38-40) synthase TruA [Bacteroidia bacterium]